MDAHLQDMSWELLNLLLSDHVDLKATTKKNVCTVHIALNDKYT